MSRGSPTTSTKCRQNNPAFYVTPESLLPYIWCVPYFFFTILSFAVILYQTIPVPKSSQIAKRLLPPFNHYYAFIKAKNIPSVYAFMSRILCCYYRTVQYYFNNKQLIQVLFHGYEVSFVSHSRLIRLKLRARSVFVTSFTHLLTSTYETKYSIIRQYFSCVAGDLHFLK